MTFIRLPGGGMAHVRTSKPRSQRCKVCGHLCAHRFLRECDWKFPNGRTCDLLMCQNCATNIGPDIDLCPAHVLEKSRPIIHRHDCPARFAEKAGCVCICPGCRNYRDRCTCDHNG